MARSALIGALALLMATMIIIPFTTDRVSGEEGWNEGTIRLTAASGDDVTQDGYPVRTAAPGGSVNVDLQVHNDADVAQTAIMWLHKPDDWHCVLTGSVMIPPGASDKVTLRVDVPFHKGLDPDGTYTFRVEAVGNVTGDRAFIMVLLKIESRIDHNFLLYPDNVMVKDHQVYPGQRTFMDLLVRNTGDISDTYVMTVGEHRTDWDIQFREGSDELRVDLSPMEFEDIYMTRLEVAIPDIAVPGEALDLTVECSSELANLHDLGKGSSTVLLRLNVINGASMDLLPSTSRMLVNASKETSLEVLVVHSGLIGCSYTPYAQVLKEGTSLSDWNLVIVNDGDGTLEIAETERFTVLFKVPGNAIGEHVLRVGVRSTQGRTRPVDVGLTVIQRPEVSIENIQGGPFLKLDDVELTLDLVNFGATATDVVVSALDVPRGLMAEFDPAGPQRLGPGALKGLKLTFRPTETAVRADFDVKVLCHYVDPWTGALLEGPSTTHRVVFVEAHDVSVLDLEVPDGQVREGISVPLNVTVRNSGQVDIGRLDIVLYEVTFSLSRIEIARNSTSLSAGEVKDLTFTWMARPSAQSIRAEVQLGMGIVDQVPDDNVASRPVYVIPAKVGPDRSSEIGDGAYIPAGAALAGALGFGALAGLIIFLVNTDLFRYPFFFTMYPLYSKLRPETLLSNRLRKRIYVYVQNNPGEHFRSILVKLNLTNGTLAHHLYTLEKEDLIRSEKDGLYRRFYPAGYHLTEGTSRLSPIQRSILDCIEKRPGLSQKEISDQLGMSSSTVNYNVKVLEEKTIIESRRVGKSTSLYPVLDKNS